MTLVDRFSVSLDTELLAAFDRHIVDKGYVNRSEAVRDLIRDLLLADRREQSDAQVIGIVNAVCENGSASPGDSLRTVFAEESKHILFQTVVTLDSDRDCLLVVLKGAARDIEGVANRIRAQRCVTSASFERFASSNGDPGR